MTKIRSSCCHGWTQALWAVQLCLLPRGEPRVCQQMQGYSKAELEPPESAERWIMVLERLSNVWRLEQFPETKKGRHGRIERKLSQDLTGSFQSSKKREIPPEYTGSSFHLRDDQQEQAPQRGGEFPSWQDIHWAESLAVCSSWTLL